MKHMKKILFLILIIMAAVIFISCGGDDMKDREAYSPEDGAYEVMLKPDKWELSLAFDQYSNRLGLFSKDASIFIYIDNYKKSTLLNSDISDLDGAIGFFKTGDMLKSMYESEAAINRTIGDLIDVDKNTLKKSAVKQAKRQKIEMPASTDDGINSTIEIIYLETENHFLSLYYVSLSENFAESQKAADEIIAYITTEK